MIQLAEVFQDYMILQRRKPIWLWGRCTRAEHITIWLEENLLAEADLGEGDFRLELPAQEAAEDVTLRICGEDGTEIRLEHVAIGEVWIAGGQSNMDFLLLCDKESKETVNGAADPYFRFYNVGKYAFEGERADGFKDETYWYRWMKFDAEHAPYFSAVAAYFGRKLRENMNCPVGIIGLSWGGTSASAWMAEEILRKDDILRVYTDTYDAAVKCIRLEKYAAQNRIMRQRAAAPEVEKQQKQILKTERTAPPDCKTKLMGKLFSKMMKIGPHSENRPGALYENMVKSVAGYTARGVIWYQGENDEKYADIYGRLFTKLIGCWRSAWGEQLPFLFVQLAPFEAWNQCTGVRFPIVREQQQTVEDTVENAWMASIMDAGSRYDIHPKRKRPVGERLALLALNKVYGKEVACEAPRIMRIEREKDTLKVTFLHAEGGLVARSGLTELFEVVQEKKKLAYTAKIQSDSVVLQMNGMKEGKPVTVSLAYVPYVEMSLYNQAGLAARPCAPREV